MTTYNTIRRGASKGPLALLLLLLFTGCGGQRENLAALEPADLFARGEAEFQQGDWDEAIRFLEFFANQHLGDPRVPESRMMLGDAYTAKRDYATAAMHYQRLVNDFPFHERSLEARFKTCDVYYEMSPRPQLDQEFTISAILHCESVAEYYPNTDQAREALAYVADLRDKLAQKAYDTGVHYFRRRAYDSAVVYFQDVIDRYPQTDFAPLALSQLVETYSRIGYVEDADEARARLLREYPQSPEAQAFAETN